MFKLINLQQGKYINNGSLLAAIVLMLIPVTLPAQGNILEEITVTATRRAMTIQDIPYNISAMTGEELKNAGVFSIADLSRSVPGIAFSDLGVRSGGVNNQLILRGLNTNAQGGISAFLPNLNPAGVSTYMDNTPLFTNLRMTDLERVEVLRGPQGTLYGAGSIGGTLRFIFNKPDPEAFSAEINTGFAAVEDSDDLNYNVDGVVNVPLGETAALRISAGIEEMAGFIDGDRFAVGGFTNPQIADPTDPFGTGLLTESRKDTDGSEQWYVRASLLWKISERFNAQLTYHRQEDDADGFSYQTNSDVPGARERTHSQYFTSPLAREVDLVSLDLEYDLGFARVESATSYTENKAQNDGELTFITNVIDAATGGFAFGGFPATNGRLAGYYQDVADSKSVVQELRLISQGESKVDWIAGFYYQDIDFTDFEDVFSPGFAAFANTPGFSGAPGNPFAAFPLPPFLSFANILAGPPTFVTQAAIDAESFITLDRQVDIEDIALFGELTYHVTDAWQVTAGVRVFWNEHGNTLISTNPLSGAAVAQDGMDRSGLNASSNTVDEQDEIFKINTSYDFNEDLMAYFTWAEGFRRGGSNAFPLSGIYTEDPSLLAYQSDKVTNYEIGVKGVLFDRLSYTAAIFRVDWDNPQISTGLLPSGFPSAVNAEEARTQGVELEGIWAVSDALRLTVGYTYTDAELTEDFATPIGPVGPFPDAAGTDGAPLPGVPESMATWALDYERPVNFMGESMLRFRVDGSYRSSVVTDSSPTSVRYAELPGFDIWNASLTWTNDHWRVGAFVKNIGDETGVTSVIRNSPIRPIDSMDYVSRPRTIGMTFGYTY
ncbi:MAG: TonB-dependent receptor [Gammaproteobacteria bacterium]|nr:TonB-dependent receptor [Gammaproteobacteria bacterium]